MQHFPPLFTSFQSYHLVPLHPSKGMMGLCVCVCVCVCHYELMNLYIFDMFKSTEVFTLILKISGQLEAL